MASPSLTNQTTFANKIKVMIRVNLRGQANPRASYASLSPLNVIANYNFLIDKQVMYSTFRIQCPQLGTYVHILLQYYCFNTTFFCECLQSTGWTALFFGAKDGDLDLIRLLIQGGANVELKDKVYYYFYLQLVSS